MLFHWGKLFRVSNILGNTWPLPSVFTNNLFGKLEGDGDGNRDW